MCGIVGGIAERDVVPILMEGLRRLEYRGYDSAGMAVRERSGHLQRFRTIGKVSNLDSIVSQTGLRQVKIRWMGSWWNKSSDIPRCSIWVGKRWKPSGMDGAMRSSRIIAACMLRFPGN